LKCENFLFTTGKIGPILYYREGDEMTNYVFRNNATFKTVKVLATTADEALNQVLAANPGTRWVQYTLVSSFKTYS